jgi:HEAT repeat protein
MLTLPSKPNLEHLKNQAKAKQQREQSTLAQAQFALARAYGFPSWTRLKVFVEAKMTKQAKPAALTKELLEYAVADPQQLGRRFAQMPLHEILAVRTYALETNTISILIDGLLKGCTHLEARVRFDCATALDHMADERCIPVLKQLLQDPVPKVRRAAIHSISCEACKVSKFNNQDDDLIAIFIQMVLHDSSPRVQMAAIGALTQTCTDARAKPIFEKVLTMNINSVFKKTLTRALNQLKESKSLS